MNRVKPYVVALIVVLTLFSLGACGRGKAGSSGMSNANATATAVVEETATPEIAEDATEADLTAAAAVDEGKDAGNDTQSGLSASEEISETDELIDMQSITGTQVMTGTQDTSSAAVDADAEDEADLGAGEDAADAEDEANIAAGEGLDAADAPTHQEATLGTILTDPGGMTLYIFDNDEPSKSTCTGDCLVNWPPLLVDNEDQTLANHEVLGEIGTIESIDNMLQVTIGGHPLYYYSKDMQPGDVNGQGVNDLWWAVTPDGVQAGK